MYKCDLINQIVTFCFFKKYQFKILEFLAPQASLLKPLSGSTGPAVHPHDLTGLAKSNL